MNKQPTLWVGVGQTRQDARQQALVQQALVQQANGLLASGLEAGQPMRVFWRVRPSGARSLHLVPLHGPRTPGVQGFTLLDFALGEGRA